MFYGDKTSNIDKGMTTKEKASNLFEYYKSQISGSDFHIPEFISGVGMDSDEYGEVLVYHTNNLAKQCALIAVDEIEEQLMEIGRDDNDYTPDHDIRFWEKVKQEIDKL